ncbi:MULTISPECIES: endonuclease/exonuclease/phosphatase family protein [Streptomyces]|uniref:Endonuclease n=1 Tax=Streptomyces venezuelae TaxID=54571 RepID=A0A5P2B565_STRVZ|nr:endonuclease/exonuclease/phosphatase family protein [Streptomyces venezuelae]MYY87491.1 endonuclease [Streptomyces sp. SID335]MYZ18866.1 endonuclease [Streptomyces sp. SID337]NDZ84588.1 endonuclease/exonuclease/phosphatase family protein [Streptomyces sp. SID10115]NEA04055.1 endonuclease/exonuclease/phosphatase family protein [Streptomyces sp. SID10116]NEB48453.1 endonuclease/exonuclease/phosphatase family protein [Streptomyces sp. SID339]
MPTDPRVTRRSGLRTAFAAAAALPLLTTALATAPAHAVQRPGRRLEVMSFNLRYASTTPPNTWADRRPVTRELLRRTRPHIVGTQEGLYQQVRDIAADLGPHYDWIGTGRAGGSRDEFMAVFYDTRRLAPVEYDHYWLSDTPEMIGSNTWGGGSIRMVTWVRFHDLRTDDELYVLNTHLDNASQYARARAAQLVVERLARLDRSLPLLVTGDFNVAAHKNPVYDTLLGAGLVDTWDAADRRSKAYATFHGYKPLTPDGDRIDWILATPGVRIHEAAINTFSLDGQFPSDHLPVQASLTL